MQLFTHDFENHMLLPNDSNYTSALYEGKSENNKGRYTPAGSNQDKSVPSQWELLLTNVIRSQLKLHEENKVKPSLTETQNK